MKQSLWIIALAGLGSAAAFAQDHAEIDKSQIIGNRELPKVLYIVPWKKPAPGDLTGRPMQSVLDESMAPLDKDVFQRQVKYENHALADPKDAAPSGERRADQNAGKATDKPIGK